MNEVISNLMNVKMRNVTAGKMKISSKTRAEPTPLHKPTLYIHIGHSKVASSALQKLLASNKSSIERQGLGIVNGRMQIDIEYEVTSFPIAILNVESNDQNIAKTTFELKKNC